MQSVVPAKALKSVVAAILCASLMLTTYFPFPLMAQGVQQNDFLAVELIHNIQEVWEARDYNSWVLAGDKPTSGGTANYTTGWLALHVEPGAPLNGFTQAGVLTTEFGARWFVYSTVGIVEPCLVGSPEWPRQGGGYNGCVGDYGYMAGNPPYATTWLKPELVTYGQGFWIARIWDDYGNVIDAAKINSTNTVITRAYVASEETWTSATNPQLRMLFYHWHPQYMRWGTGWQEWASSYGPGGSTNFLNSYREPNPPGGFPCPSIYASATNLGGDPRYWASSNYGGSFVACSINPLW